MTKTELKQHWATKTLGEIKGHYTELKRVQENMQHHIKKYAKDIVSLDVTAENYISKLKDNSNHIKSMTKDLQDNINLCNILKPILDKKEIEGINQAEYDNYINNNKPLKILIDAVEEHKKEFINNGSKVIIITKDLKEHKIFLTEKQVNEMYESMLKETIMLIKDNEIWIYKILEINRGTIKAFETKFKCKSN